MKNIDAIYEECKAICDDLQIPYKEGTPISFNGRLTRKWGYCRKKSGGEFEISVSSVLGRDDTPDKTLKSVILHELLHTCPGCFNHGKRWKAYGKAVKDAYGIKIRTTSDAEDMNIKPHYYIKCRRCEMKVWYVMKPRNTERCCIVCKSKMLSCFYKDEYEKQRLWKRG